MLLKKKQVTRCHEPDSIGNRREEEKNASNNGRKDVNKKEADRNGDHDYSGNQQVITNNLSSNGIFRFTHQHLL